MYVLMQTLYFLAFLSQLYFFITSKDAVYLVAANTFVILSMLTKDGDSK